MQEVQYSYSTQYSKTMEVQANKQNMIRLPRTSAGSSVGWSRVHIQSLTDGCDATKLNERMNCKEPEAETGPRQIVVNILSRCST